MSDNQFVVIDIGSRSVGGGIFEKQPSGTPLLTFTARQAIEFRRQVSGNTLLTLMVRALEMVLMRLEEHSDRKFRASRIFIHRDNPVTVTISSPWHASETKVLRLHYDKPTTVTKAAIDRLLAEEETSFERRLAKKNFDENRFEPLERRVIETRLNGYPTLDPLGKTATDLELHVFESVTSPQIVKKIAGTVSLKFSSERLRFSAFSLAAFAPIRALFPETEHFLLVQVDGEITDITVVKNGVIAEMVSFPFGHNHLLRKLSEICLGHPDCALESLVSLHNQARISSLERRRVDDAIIETKALWLSQFNAAVSNFCEEMFLPKTVFLFEDQSYLSLFEEFLKQAESSQFTVTGESFIVKKMNDPNSAALFAEMNPGVSFDPVLSMEACFASRFGGN